MRRILLVVAVCLIAGCAPRPNITPLLPGGALPQSITIACPAPAAQTADQLGKKIEEVRALVQNLQVYQTNCEKERREKVLAAWRTRLYWGAAICAVLAVVAFFLLARFVSFSLAWKVAAGLASLAILCPVVGWILGHLTLVLVLLALLAAGAIALKVFGKWQAMVDGAKIALKQLRGTDYAQALAEADVHNVASYEPWAAKITGEE